MGVRSLLAMSLIGGVFVCLPRFEIAEALELIAVEKITNLYLVPTLYHDLIQNGMFAKTDVGSVRNLGFAGAPMTDGLLKELRAAFKPDLFVNHYGSSEIYTFTINQNAPAKPGSAGRAGINQRIRVAKLGALTPDDLAAVGEEGEIIASLMSDEAFEGYWRRADADANALREGWYFTGDTGYFDEDGDLFVTGRVDDMIITGGENVSPVEIENCLSLHPAVSEVAVVGVPDERWGRWSRLSSNDAGRSNRTSSTGSAVLPAWPISSARGAMSSSTKFLNLRSESSCAASWWQANSRPRVREEREHEQNDLQRSASGGSQRVRSRSRRRQTARGCNLAPATPERNRDA
jgi:acyl-CoA synthetase (AMP-forming)/AMP-acid ligase II